MTRFDEETTVSSGDTTIYIRDSGWRKTGLTSPDGTHNESGNETTIAGKKTSGTFNNQGQAIRLKAVQLRMRQAANVNNDSIVQKYDSNLQTSDLTFGIVDLGSMGNPVWTIRGRLDLRDSDDQTKLQYLAQMARTRGYKELAVPSDSTRNYHIIRWINPDNHNHGTYSHKAPTDSASITTVGVYGTDDGGDLQAVNLSHVHGRVSEVSFVQLGGDYYGWIGYNITFIETL